MNYQASNPENLSETPERLSETKTRSGSPAAAAKKRAAEVLTLCTNLSMLVSLARPFTRTLRYCNDSWRKCSISSVISRKSRGGDRFTHYQTLYQSLPGLRSSFVLVKGLYFRPHCGPAASSQGLPEFCFNFSHFCSAPLPINYPNLIVTKTNKKLKVPCYCTTK